MNVKANTTIQSQSSGQLKQCVTRTLCVKKEGFIEWEESLCCCLLVFLGPELLRAVVKELLIHLHEELQSVVDEAVDGPVSRHTHSQDYHRLSQTIK